MANIVLVAGGTGGHLFPAIGVAQEFSKRGHNVTLISDTRCRDYLQNSQGFDYIINDGRINLGSIKNIIKSLPQLLSNLWCDLLLLKRLKPSALIAFGGYTTISTIIVAKFLAIPIILQEQNSIIGKTNRILMRYAKLIAVSYKNTVNVHLVDKDKLLFIGNIIRNEIRHIQIKKNSTEGHLFRIVVIGGSQGAKVFTSLIPDAIKMVLAQVGHTKIAITQQVRAEDLNAVSDIYKNLQIEYKLASFFHNIAEVYAQADLVIARAGATTIAELTYLKIPAIYIPLTHATDNHQLHNASSISDAGGGWYFIQNEFTSYNIATKIIELINNLHLLSIASEHLQNHQSNGHNLIVDTVEQIII